MTNQHPITPPFDLVKQWAEESPMELSEDSWAYELFIAHQAARWGADQELDACCWWLNKEINTGWCLDPQLRAARRPKPTSLKEQALDELVSAERLYPADWSTIRKALEALPND
jgi:hypothetical protein